MALENLDTAFGTGSGEAVATATEVNKPQMIQDGHIALQGAEIVPPLPTTEWEPPELPAMNQDVHVLPDVEPRFVDTHPI